MLEKLSKREVELLRLVSDGCDNKEIAKRLYISPHTVKAHLSNIYSKLGILGSKKIITRLKAALIYLRENNNESY